LPGFVNKPGSDPPLNPGKKRQKKATKMLGSFVLILLEAHPSLQNCNLLAPWRLWEKLFDFLGLGRGSSTSRQL
jgi:hypothetical protein